MVRAHGFPLTELLIVIVIIGIVSAALAPEFSALLTAQRSAYVQKHHLNNQLIGAALLGYAANSTQTGRLPAPYSGNGYTSTVYNPGDGSGAGVALANALTQSGINPSEINDDGTAFQAVRVYQLVQGLAQQVPLYFQSGPLVTLSYDFGAVYLTTCAKSSVSCNPTPATGIPGASAALTPGNYGSWSAVDPDARAHYVSSLPIQKQMLATTVQRQEKIRDTLISYLRANQVTAGGGDATNWYPNQAGAAAAGTLGGANPSSNQGCRDGWYSLSSAGVAVLATAGLGQDEFGKTAWGGPIEYCRDYDPTGTKTPNAAPHYGAIRILANVTAGATPDAVVPGNNVVLTF